MKNKRILFARIGYMKFYQGPQPGDDKPIKGGKHNKNGVGHELYNFFPIKGKLFGYFQPNMVDPYEINLGRIERGWSAGEVDDVLVIWFASNPIGKGQIIIGWYKSATVFRAIQSPKNLPERQNYSYNVVTNIENATLLPISKRRYPMGHSLEEIKKGNPGQANSFYILDSKGNLKDQSDPKNSWVREAIEYVESYSSERISSPEDEINEQIRTINSGCGGQGFESDVITRLKIEEYSMERCASHFSGKGFAIKDVSKIKSYDYEIEKNGDIFLVEVKGTRTKGDSIILTKNEVNLCRKNSKHMILFIVHSIELNKKNVVANSGVIKIFHPWKIEEKQLTPIAYTYELG